MQRVFAWFVSAALIAAFVVAVPMAPAGAATTITPPPGSSVDTADHDLTGGLTIDVSSGQAVTFTGTFSGTGDLAVVGTGTVTFGVADQLPATTALTVDGATVDLAGFHQTVASLVMHGGAVNSSLISPLTLAGDVTYDGTGAIGALDLPLGVTHTFTATTPDATLDLGSLEPDVGPPLAKAGPGSLRLLDACWYVGPLSVQAGSVDAVNGYGGLVSVSPGASFVGDTDTCPPTPICGRFPDLLSCRGILPPSVSIPDPLEVAPAFTG